MTVHTAPPTPGRHGPTPVEVAVLDMAGTTVEEHGAVEANVVAALASVDVMLDGERLHRLRGGRKREMFHDLVDDAARAELAYHRFLDGMTAAVADGRICAKPGATNAFDALHDAGAKVCLVTGFPPELRGTILAALGWEDAVDLVLSPEDAGRGRPHPDLIWAAMSRLEATGVQSVAVAGDTQSDLLAGYRSGAATVVGVLGGAHSATDLRRMPHTHLIDGIDDLAAVVL